MNRADLIGGLGITALGLLLIFVVIPQGTASGMYYGLPPTFFPTVMATGLTASAVGLTIQSWRRRARKVDAAPSPLSLWNLLMFLLAAALAVTGVVAIDYLGMIYAGPALIAAFMLFMGERSLLRIVLTSVLPVAAVYLLARYVLYAPLP
jgi:Tripartite tricarboxylate transporter TctB family